MTVKWGDPAANNLAEEVGMGWIECLHQVLAEEEGIVFFAVHSCMSTSKDL
jgi:hypothetical protein